MIITTFDLYFGRSLLRGQSQERSNLLIGNLLYPFLPVNLGRPHEVDGLAASIRYITLRSKTPIDPSFTEKSIGVFACNSSGLIGATVETRIYDIDYQANGYSELRTAKPVTIYQEQVIEASSNDVDLRLTLSTESQPLKQWIGF